MQSTRSDVSKNRIHVFLLLFLLVANYIVIALQSASYFDSIPPVPEYGTHRRHDATKLREIRKKLDTITGTNEADIIAMDCMDELAEICSGKFILSFLVKVSQSGTYPIFRIS